MTTEKIIRAIKRAELFAETFSKDNSTKVGAELIDPSDFTVITRGYNGMPRGVDESPEDRNNRPLKYSFFEHAERNAIYNKARKHLKGSLAITTSAPSLSCTRALISVGTKEVYFYTENPCMQVDALSAAMMSEAGVSYRVVTPAELMAEASEGCRRSRKIAQFADFADKQASLMGKKASATGTLFLDRDDFTVLSEGYSGQPRGANDSETGRYEDERKNTWIESSIRNAVFNAVRAELKGSIAIVTATTCVECARALASVGVKHIFYREPPDDFASRWGDSIKEALGLLAELNVTATAVPR